MGRQTGRFQLSLPLIHGLKSPIPAAAAPHLIIVLAVIGYVIFGAIVFMHLDDEIAEQSFYVSLLFAFTTISTIGYGNIAPKSLGSQTFCIAYVTFGIPLLFLALGNLGKFLVAGYWKLVEKLRKQERDCTPTSDSKEHLPIAIILFLLLNHTLLGGLLFHITEDQLEFQTSIYFSFISFTTIGYGDIYPTPQSGKHVIGIILYLTSGMVIMSTFVAALGSHLQRIHYLGRPFKGAQDVDVWFGGQCLSVTELLRLVASQFQVSPEELQVLLRDLDTIIEDACFHNTNRSRQLSFSSTEVLEFGYHTLTSQSSRADHIIQLEFDDSILKSHDSAQSISRPKLRRWQSNSSLKSCASKNKRLNKRRKSLGSANHDALFKVLGMLYRVSQQQSFPLSDASKYSTAN
uniref:Potassium channel domain-containing protein n=1 Tax=Plectus sambesii TaxID=2011161 RepID=A0A914VG55_9BILA